MKWFLSIIAILVICMVPSRWFGCHRDPYPPVEEPPRSTAPPRVPPPPPIRSGNQSNAKFDAAVDRRLAWATKEVHGQIVRTLSEVEEIFHQAKKGVSGFVDDALGYRSKFYLLWDYTPEWGPHRYRWNCIPVPRLPWNDWPFRKTGDRHINYVRERWQHHVFSKEDFVNKLQHILDRHFKQVQDIENQMLVMIRADAELAQMPTSRIQPEELRRRFREAIKKSARANEKHTVSCVGRELVSLLIWKVLSQAAARLGVSSALLASGAAGAPETAGSSLILVLIVDRIVCEIWDYWTNPRGTLYRQIVHQLDELQDAIIEGTEEHPGMRQMLREMAGQRMVAWRRAIREAFEQ